VVVTVLISLFAVSFLKRWGRFGADEVNICQDFFSRC
jgi:hypothetical protein